MTLRLFGLQYDDGGLGQEFAKKIEETLLTLPSNLLLTGDFNFAAPERLYSDFIKNKELQKVDFGVSDTDHVFVPKNIQVTRTKVIETRSDHNLHIVELKL